MPASGGWSIVWYLNLTADSAGNSSWMRLWSFFVRGFRDWGLGWVGSGQWAGGQVGRWAGGQCEWAAVWVGRVVSVFVVSTIVSIGVSSMYRRSSELFHPQPSEWVVILMQHEQSLAMCSSTNIPPFSSFFLLHQNPSHSWSMGHLGTNWYAPLVRSCSTSYGWTSCLS